MDELPELTSQDLTHLRRGVDLAREALAGGDEPCGSVLVDPGVVVLHEDRNRTAGGDQTRHPEPELARWAAVQVAPQTRPTCAVHTPGEHCPMRVRSCLGRARPSRGRRSDPGERKLAS